MKTLYLTVTVSNDDAQGVMENLQKLGGTVKLIPQRENEVVVTTDAAVDEFSFAAHANVY